MIQYYVIEAKTYGQIVYKGTLKELAEKLNDKYGKLKRSNVRKSLYKGKYNIVREDEEYVGFNKAIEYAVSNVENNEFIEFIGIKEEITQKYGIKDTLFYKYPNYNYVYKDTYRIFKIED